VTGVGDVYGRFLFSALFAGSTWSLSFDAHPFHHYSPVRSPYLNVSYGNKIRRQTGRSSHESLLLGGRAGSRRLYSPADNPST
jgi:hypothetical protein